MNAENAAGRKTDRFERAARRYEEKLEAQLELLTDAMRGSVTRAGAVEDNEDEYGHRRDSHIGQAVKIGAVSAQIVLALSKLGGEFTHNINVNRSSEDSAGDKPGKPFVHELDSNPRIRRKYLSEEEYEKTRAYYEVPRSSSHPPLDRALKEYHAERDAELAAEAAAANDAEGDPPPENSGSNG
jgi:hypothetical protein